MGTLTVESFSPHGVQMIGYFVAAFGIDCLIVHFFPVLQIFTLRLVADFVISGFVTEMDPISFVNSSFPNEYVDLKKGGKIVSDKAAYIFTERCRNNKQPDLKT